MDSESVECRFGTNTAMQVIVTDKTAIVLINITADLIGCWRTVLMNPEPFGPSVDRTG